MAKLRKKRKKYRFLRRFLVALGIVTASIGILILVFKVRAITVEGNVQYSEEEIKNIIMEDAKIDNSIYFYLKYKLGKTKDVAFIDTLSIKLRSPSAIVIDVYEKGMVGYFKHLESYMYFDKDGIVVESSTQIIAGIPQIKGLDFEQVVLYEKLPVEDQDIFTTILNLTQAISKYDVHPNTIKFNKNQEVTLQLENIKVLLGKNHLMREKIQKLSSIIPNLNEIPGTLHLENFTENTDDIVFEKK